MPSSSPSTARPRGRIALDEDGVAIVELTAPQAGNAVLGVRYAGDIDYLPSEDRVTQTIVGGAAATTTALPRPLTRAGLLAALAIPKRIVVSVEG